MNQSSSKKRNSVSLWLYGLTLRSRLTAFILVVSLVPLAIIAIRDILQTQQALSKAAEISLSSSALQTANSLDTFIQSTLDEVRVTGQFSDFVEYFRLFPSKRIGSVQEERSADILKKLTNKDTVNIISYGLLDLTGKVLLDTVESNIGKDESRNDYFVNLLDRKLPTVSAVTYGDNTTPIIQFAALVKSSTGEIVGVLRVKYRSTILQQIIRNSIGKSTNSRVTLLDEYNIRLADTQQPELIQKSVTPLFIDKYALAIKDKRLLETTPELQATNLQDFALRLNNANNQPFFTTDLDPDVLGDDSVSVAYMTSRPWLVAYSQPTSAFLAEIQGQTRANVSLTIVFSLLIAVIAAMIARTLTFPILHLTETANRIALGNLDERATIENADEIGSLATTFNYMTEQLQGTLSGLEQRVAERTAALERRSAELAIVAEVARDINTIRNVDTLLNLTVGLIRERFNAYHVAIYLTDDRGEYISLRAASGNAGQLMLESKYRLKLNGPGIIAFVSRTGESRLALDVEKDAAFIKNPLLPETRSEITLPLRTANSIIGVLDIQSTDSSAFSNENTQTMQLLADQIVGALDNAQLLQQLENTLQELNVARQAQTQSTWQRLIRNRNQNAMEYDGTQTKPMSRPIAPDVLMQLQNGKPLLIDDTNGEKRGQKTLLVPLLILDQVVGVIGLEQESTDHQWSDDEINLARAAALRAALSLENARLLDESQKRANKERSISAAANRIESMQQIENILYATAEELERTLGGSEVVIQFQNKE